MELDQEPTIPSDPEHIGSRLIKEHLKDHRKLHVRQSLNQYYYDSTSRADDEDHGIHKGAYEYTHRRDQDQVVYNHTNHGSGKIKDNAKETEVSKHTQYKYLNLIKMQRGLPQVSICS